MEARQNTLTITGLRTEFLTPEGPLAAVDGVDLAIPRGSIVGLVGESGCGKSVTALSVLGLVPPAGRVAAGEIRFGETDLRTLGEGALRKLRGNRIAMIFQDPMTSLNPVYPVGRQVAEVLRLHRRLDRWAAKARTVELFQQVGIPDPAARYDAYPRQLSGGLRQRVMIVMAMACEPELLIADEPTTALDVTIQAQILELINRLKKERRLSVIFITHDLGVVANMADRIAIMYAGKIVEYGTADDVFYDPRHPYTWALLSSMPDLETREKLEAIPGTPPDMILPPKGDAFAARNKYAMEIDFEEQPPMFHVSETHMAATWLLHPNAPKVNPPAIVVERIERMKKEQAEREAAEALQNAKKGAAEA